MRVAVAFDHRGVKLRERVLEEIARAGHEPVDLGTDAPEPRIDYPDKAREVGERDPERATPSAESWSAARASARRSPPASSTGIRAAICHDTYSAHQGVEHDDMNVLCSAPR